MAARIAAHDWHTHPLGPPAGWPVELKTTLSIMLGSSFAMCLGWGPDQLLFYNDPYQPMLGAKERGALGLPIREVWSELWDDIRPLVESAMSGTPTWKEDMHLVMQRHGYAEDTWWTFSYSPVRAADGGVVAMLNTTHETTRRVLTERRLADEHARMARMFDQAPTFMALLRGPDHRIEFANASYMAMVGRENVVGRPLVEILPDAVARGYLEPIEQVYASGRAFVAYGARYVGPPSADAPSGQEHHLDYICQPVRDEDGSIGGIFVVGVDVTARIVGEIALRQREAELQALNESLERRVAEHARERSLIWQTTPDMLGVLNHDGVLEKSNPAWERTLGWTSAELASHPARDLLHPDDVDDAVAAGQRMRAGEPLMGFECRMRTRDGRYRTLSWMATPQDDKFYCSARDVTEVNAATRALADSQALLRSLFESSYQLQGRCALDGTLQDSNRTSLDAIGCGLDEVVGLPYWDTPWFRGTPGASERIRAAFARAVAGEEVREEIVLELPGGAHTYDLSLRPLYDAAGAITAVVPEALDISHRRNAEEALRQSQKLEAMGQLTGGVAHDFNNLLTPILAALELASDDDADPARRGRTINVARQSAERAAVLVQRLLAFARRQPLQATRVDVRRLVDDIGDLMRSSCDPRIRVQADVTGEVPDAHADANQLEMALLNLGVNARDAMPDGGTLTLSARAAWSDAGNGSSLAPGPYVVVTVGDTGLGMDAATRMRAIEPFFTTKGLGKGTGLGLSMVHGLASQLGGRLRIDSTPGQGTRIELWLPACPPAGNR
ncbi:PAS domain-containing protein [Xanthomonas sp. XNM01]|uniref:PAS domain-containing protein n=1 Tax=Xanthomonas sp. XNM01 TaxID=2769289 RepID=UPI0017837155|nr:PAS domain-containing protein [Xanthomonas sp. XNM01]MBD9370984.1 PAS domain-containing protein [Xanthomonas sp. XNM01]